MQPRRALASAAAALVLLAAVLVVPAAASPARGRRLAKAPKPEASPPQAFPAAPADCCAALAAVGLRSELPVVVLDSGGQPIPHHVDTPVALCTCANGSPFQDYAGPALAAGRGSSSSTFAKKSYAVALKAPGGGKAAFPFLGMPVDEDWILYGDETADKTLGLRNFATYNLARASGHYASRTVWAELYLVDDGAPLGPQHYNGLYIGEEKVKRAKARVDIAKLAPPDLSGGYIWLYDNDNIESSDTTFGPAPGWDHPFLLKEPKAAPDGGAALLRYIDDFQAALEAPDWLARGPNASYTAFIDGPSFADFFLLVELSKSPDGYRGSTFMHKDRGGPMAFGPVWDYNEAYGACCGYPIDGWQRQGASGPGVSGGSAISPEGWRYNICDDPGRCLVEPKDGTSRWFRRLRLDPRFRQAALARWQQLRAGPWSDAALEALIGDAAARIQPAAARNYDRYAGIFGVAAGTGAGAAAWAGEVAAMQDWLRKRVAWLDSALQVDAASAAGR